MGRINYNRNRSLRRIRINIEFGLALCIADSCTGAEGKVNIDGGRINTGICIRDPYLIGLHLFPDPGGSNGNLP
jgi:hypothetical protein